MVGAILTQGTNWRNVERAIDNLKRSSCLGWEAMSALSPDALADLIRPSGYHRVKAGRLFALCEAVSSVGGEWRSLGDGPLEAARLRLLGIKGVGPETADSILLYAFGRPTFVVDAYTRRVLSRHGLVVEKASYDEVREFIMERLPGDPALFNDFHAQFVALGKTHCRPTPRCAGCPAGNWAETVKEMAS
jgi:endonuclease-3 related protein